MSRKLGLTEVLAFGAAGACLLWAAGVNVPGISAPACGRPHDWTSTNLGGSQSTVDKRCAPTWDKEYPGWRNK